MTTSFAYYTQKDFENIIHKGISHTIPMDILNNIRKLEDKVKQSVSSAPTYRHNRVPNHHSQQTNMNSNTSSSSTSDIVHKKQDWKGAKPLAVTMAIKSTSPLHQIKLLLNKLSPSNFTKVKGDILTVLTESPLTIETANDILLIMSRTVEISMSELYMELYLELETVFPAIMNEVWNNFETKYQQKLKTQIPAMAPQEENDEYCAFVKSMTELRGQTIFVTQWCKYHKRQEQAIHILNSLFQDMNQVLEDTNGKQKTRIDEWTEQVFWIVKILGNVKQEFPDIWSKISHYGQINIKTTPNMTSRSKFKFQDMNK